MSFACAVVVVCSVRCVLRVLCPAGRDGYPASPEPSFCKQHRQKNETSKDSTAENRQRKNATATRGNLPSPSNEKVSRACGCLKGALMFLFCLLFVVAGSRF